MSEWEKHTTADGAVISVYRPMLLVAPKYWSKDHRDHVMEMIQQAAESMNVRLIDDDGRNKGTTPEDVGFPSKPDSMQTPDSPRHDR